MTGSAVCRDRSRCCVVLAGCSGVQRDPPHPGLGRHEAPAEVQAAGADDRTCFADHRESRRAAGRHHRARPHAEDNRLTTRAWKASMYVGKNPVPVTAALLNEGQAKFNTYCSPCHDQTGMGQGIVPHTLPGLAAVEPDGGSHGADRRRRYLQRDHQRPADHAAVPLSRSCRRIAGRSSLMCACCSAPRTAPCNDVPAEPQIER